MSALPEDHDGATPAEGKSVSRIRDFWRMLGPGFIAGASDDDPSGIGTYVVAGASAGFATLWTALVTFPMVTAVQFICAKVAMVSGEGLGCVLRKHYSRPIAYSAMVALLVANTINAGADLGAIAAAFNLLIPVPIPLLIVAIAAVVLAVQIWGSYRFIASIFKWLTLSLLAYVGAAFLAHPDWGKVIRATVVPSFQWNPHFLSLLVAILGTTISPYLFFWQASQEVEEAIAKGQVSLSDRRGATRRELKLAAWDVNIGMLFSNVVMYFVILATGATLFKAGHHDVQTARDAALALRPLAGTFAEALFALGMIGAGFLAVPVLTGSAAYAVAEVLSWRRGLNQKPKRAPHFYALIIISTGVAVLINFVGLNPISALFWTAVLNGFVAPPLLVLLMLVSNNRTVMRNRVNGRGLNVLGWLTTIVMFAAAIGLVWTWKAS